LNKEYRFPFSVISEYKHNSYKSFTTVGDVTESMDKNIGRPIFRIKGAVSANNYIEFDHLNLIGGFVYMQLCILNASIATFHFEILTSENFSLRLSASTLYDGDRPRFLGRSLRFFFFLNIFYLLLDFMSLT
jgi:hypothetical protein